MAFLSIERLEARIAPATLLTPNTVTYVDPDGDTVLITASKPIFASGLDVLTFVPTGNGEQLQQIDLGANAKGVNLDIHVTATTLGSDGLADVGFVKAGGIDVGIIRIDGDLGRITAGDAAPATAAIKSLTVESLGARGVSTQAAPGSLASTFLGGVGSLEVHGSIVVASVSVGGGAAGKIGSIIVGGSIVGGDAEQSGAIVATGAITKVEIGGDLAGGNGDRSGAIISGGKIGRVLIGGSLLGGEGNGSGQVRSGIELPNLGQITKALTSGGVTELHVVGDIVGGDGDYSGALAIFGPIGRIIVGGSVSGGDGFGSGGAGFTAGVKQINVGGDLKGGIGESSGSFGTVIGKVVSYGDISIGGDLIAGSGRESGKLRLGTTGHVKIGGDIVGGIASGFVSGGRSIEIGGSILAGNNSDSGFSGGIVDRVIVSGDVSGRISVASVKKLFVGGSLIDAPGFAFGMIDCNMAGDVVVGGDIDGGRVQIVRVKNFHLGGSLIAGSDLYSGRLEFWKADTITISGDIIGTRTYLAGPSLTTSGTVIVQDAKSLTIGGSIKTAAVTGGFNGRSSVAIISQGSVGRIEIHGDIVGSETNRAGIYLSDVAASYFNKPTPLSVGSIEVGGNVDWAEIASTPGAAIGHYGDTAARKIGSLTVNGNWTASTLAIGIDPGTDKIFGNAGDSRASTAGSKDGVDKIVINGRVLGTAAAGDLFAFTAPRIGAMKVGSRDLPLTVGPDDFTLSPSTGSDVRVVETVF